MELESLNRKTYEQHRQHFIARLQERYSFTIPDDYYDKLCKGHFFAAEFARSGNRSVGWVRITGKVVIAMYDNELECFTTALPEQCMHDPAELIKGCFNRHVQPIAQFVYEQYLKEAELLPKEFETVKDAAIFYFNSTLFPTLHIDKYKNGTVDFFKIMHQIKRVVERTSVYVDFKLTRKPTNDTQD